MWNKDIGRGNIRIRRESTKEIKEEWAVEGAGGGGGGLYSIYLYNRLDETVKTR